MNERIAQVGEIFEKRYELLEVLGSGGIGTVFKARQLDAERLIALKILHPAIVADAEFKLRFMREAQALSKLSHENIVTVYHLGVAQTGTPYLAMELIQGTNLRHHINEAKMSQPQIFSVARQLCSALDYIHKQGIVHRDLKPDNVVFLADTEQIKIIDFGLAHIDLPQDGQKLTGTGVLIGTVNYMSPEQCKGFKADARSDLYSLTVCIYEMLTGLPPFTADNPVGLMYKHVNAEIPQLVMQSPSKSFRLLNEFLKKGLSKKPEERFQSAAEMEQAIAALIEGNADVWIEEKSAKKSGRQKLIIAAFVCAGVLALAALTIITVNQRNAASKDLVKAVSNESANPEEKMRKLLDRPDLTSTAKLQALMSYHDQYGVASDERFVAEELSLIKTLPPERVKTLVPRLYYNLSCNFFDAGKAKEALPFIESFFKSCSEENLASNNLGLDEYWTMKGFLCRSYTMHGRVKEAKVIAEQIADKCISGETEALTVALQLQDEKLAQLVIRKQDNINRLLSLARVARGFKRYDISKICLERGAHVPMPQNSAMAYRIELAKYALLTGEKNKAQKEILEIYKDPELDDYLADPRRSKFRYEICVTLERAGLQQEARKLAFEGRSNDDYINMYRAYLLAAEGKFERARQFLQKDTLVARRNVMLQQLSLIEQGKYKGPLLDLTAMPF